MVVHDIAGDYKVWVVEPSSAAAAVVVAEIVKDLALVMTAPCLVELVVDHSH